MASCGHAPKHATTAHATQGDVQNVTMHVFPAEAGVKGPDGRNHDAYVPAGFVVAAGRPVRLTVINSDDGPHTMTFDNPHAGIGPFLVKPGKRVAHGVQPVSTTFEFTPTKKGAFRWHCEAACDDGGNRWAMGHAVTLQNGASHVASERGEDGFMAGYVVVQ